MRTRIPYDSTSPYYITTVTDNYLEVLQNRPIPRQSDDQILTITVAYEYRPDILAYDLYGTAKLWWVFSQRNPNTLLDPIYDFTTGTAIFLPKLSTLKSVLGF